MNFLNGKKTSIGAALLLLAGAMSKLDIESLQTAINVIEYLGMAFSGVGLGHKGVKAKK